MLKKRIYIKSPAKINIGLNIVSKRDDGYHNLKTLFYPILDLCDDFIFEESEGFSFSCDNMLLAQDHNNLVIKAKKLLERKTSKKIKVRIILHKNIPIGAGLGGGSSNAATTLISLNDFLNLNFSLTELENFALELGSDVPFFIKGFTAIGESRGEKLTPINFEIKYPILLINNGLHISTADAFSNIEPKQSDFDYAKLALPEFANPKNFKKIISNDFEENIFLKHSELREIKEKLYIAGALYAQMSGSGSTMFGIFENIEQAEKAKKAFPENYFLFINQPAE